MSNKSDLLINNDDDLNFENNDQYIQNISQEINQRENQINYSMECQARSASPIKQSQIAVPNAHFQRHRGECALPPPQLIWK